MYITTGSYLGELLTRPKELKVVRSWKAADRSFGVTELKIKKKKNYGQ